MRSKALSANHGWLAYTSGTKPVRRGMVALKVRLASRVGSILRRQRAMSKLLLMGAPASSVPQSKYNFTVPEGDFWPLL